jgi:hypothetical protein
MYEMGAAGPGIKPLAAPPAPFGEITQLAALGGKRKSERSQ